jgi:hypothetical protein
LLIQSIILLKLNMEKKSNWNKRPKGCSRTISGMHTPAQRFPSYYTIEFFCSACGKIDDTNKFSKWFGFNSKKVDDKKQI